MITTGLLNFGVNLLLSIFPLLNLVAVPVSAIATLAQITGLAAWIVGKDLLLLIFSAIAALYAVRLGFAIFHLFLKIKG